MSRTARRYCGGPLGCGEHGDLSANEDLDKCAHTSSQARRMDGRERPTRVPPVAVYGGGGPRDRGVDRDRHGVGEEKRKSHRWLLFCTELARYRPLPAPHSADPGTGAGGLHPDSGTGPAENDWARGGVETPTTPKLGSRNSRGGGWKATWEKLGKVPRTSGTPRTAGRTAPPPRTGAQGAVPRRAPSRAQWVVLPALLLRTAQPRIAGGTNTAGRVQAMGRASAPGPLA